MFDLDGTITDSFDAVTKSFAYALESFGIYVKDRNELLPVIGPPLRQSFSEMFGFDEEKELVYIVELNNHFKNVDEKEFQSACESVKEYYKENCGMYGPAKRIVKDKIVKTYPPV